MSGHGIRTVYHMVGEDDIVDPLSQHAAGCPVSGAAAATVAAPMGQPTSSLFRFGRLFDDACACDKDAWPDLLRLGTAMNADLPKVTGATDSNDSNIPAGYTYLAQFIAHEITFDKTPGLQDMPELPISGRTPTLDLDSLYGDLLNDKQKAGMYDGDFLRLGENTDAANFILLDKYNDLPREPKTENNVKRYEAIIGDERNDENLPLAQTHLAFIKFHNRVVKDLVDNPDKRWPEMSLFKQAQRKVIRHFQKIVLDDFLPRIINPDILNAVVDGTVEGGRLIDKKVTSKGDLFMPVEFSAAAFRLGHSMVRHAYDYNYFHRAGNLFGKRAATLENFFQHTQFSGDLDGKKSLASDWVIDWRRFYDFSNAPQHSAQVGYNKAKRINTGFNLHLDQIDTYPHNVEMAYKAITVRNLIRGCCLKLPTGQCVADKLKVTKLLSAEITDGETPAVRAALADNHFDVKTPLWFYILKEAKLLGDSGNRLGPVGSRIVAETFYGIIKHSDHSIIGEPLAPPEMLPGRIPGQFDMVDLLTCLGGDVNPSQKD